MVPMLHTQSRTLMVMEFVIYSTPTRLVTAMETEHWIRMMIILLTQQDGQIALMASMDD